MEDVVAREAWTELCFHLSDNVDSGISENLFEQRVLLALEKLLGWSQFKGEIKVRPSLQIGRQNHIEPDIVLHASGKPVVVIEIKRPSEDLSRLNYFGQLQSYMRQTKSEFGILIGNQIFVYYDGVLNFNDAPLLLMKIRFKSDLSDGISFVQFFSRQNFTLKAYDKYLRQKIDFYTKKNEVEEFRQRIVSNDTQIKFIQFLKNNFVDIPQEVFDEALRGVLLRIEFQNGDNNTTRSSVILNSNFNNIMVCKNKTSGKYFVHVEDVGADSLRLINPDGHILDLQSSLFEDLKDESIDYLLSYNLVSQAQIAKYHNFISFDPSKSSSSMKGRTSKSSKSSKRLNRTSSGPVKEIGSDLGNKKASPSAEEWSRNVSELRNLARSGRVTWRAVCDLMGVHVGGDSARRALKEWARTNRPNWPTIPEP